MEHIGNIKQQSDFIWDFWSILNSPEDALTIYTLSQARANFEEGKSDLNSERDLHSHSWRRFTSADKGRTWIDQGIAFKANKETPTAFDSHSIWTGSAYNYQNIILAAYTGIRMPDANHPYLQSIGLARSYDGGKNFIRLSTALSDPLRDYEKIISLGYYLGPKDDLGTDQGEEGKSILAWRDPSILMDPSGELHLFWAAKAKINNQQEPALGHGILKNPLEENAYLELCPPIRLPLNEMNNKITQAEVPQLIADPRGTGFFLISSTCCRTDSKQTDAEVDCAVWLLSAKNLTGPWSVLTTLIDSSAHRFPGGIISCSLSEDNCPIIKFNAPYNRAAEKELQQTMPAVVDFKILSNGKIEQIKSY